MAVYLTENCVGSDAQEIAFPGLILCMGFVAQMGDGSLVGAHIGSEAEEHVVLEEMSRQIEQHDDHPARYYMATNFQRHFSGERRFSFTAKARAVGCQQGNIHIVDTAQVVDAGNHGHFVRFISNHGNDACRIYVFDDDAVQCGGLIMRNHLDENSPVRYATSAGVGRPNYVFTSAELPADAEAVGQNSIRIARCF